MRRWGRLGTTNVEGDRGGRGRCLCRGGPLYRRRRGRLSGISTRDTEGLSRDETESIGVESTHGYSNKGSQMRDRCVERSSRVIQRGKNRQRKQIGSMRGRAESPAQSHLKFSPGQLPYMAVALQAHESDTALPAPYSCCATPR